MPLSDVVAVSVHMPQKDAELFHGGATFITAEPVPGGALISLRLSNGDIYKVAVTHEELLRASVGMN
jgi:hypothetical protein